MNLVARAEAGRRTGNNGRLRRVRYHVDLLSNLVARNITLRYKGSFLGMLWSLVHPLSLIAVYSFLFARVIPLNIPNYVPFLIAGVLPWNWFTTSLNSTADAVVGNRDLVKKVLFPSEVLVIATITSDLLILALGMGVLLIFLLLSSTPLTPSVLLLPVIVAIQYALTLGLGLVISTLNVYFRDTRHLLGLVLFALFFLTPVFYDSTSVPPRYHILYLANPMAHILSTYRDVLVYGRVPSWILLGELTLGAAVILAFGLIVFRHYKSSFPEEL